MLSRKHIKHIRESALAMGGAKPPSLVDKKRFRQRAAEARAMAEKFSDPSVKKGMLDIAAMYDRLADGAEWKAEKRPQCLRDPKARRDPLT